MKTLTPSQALASAVQAIDEQFGSGYAADNPALVAGMVQAVAMLEIDVTLGEGLRNLGH
jgi:hypothetical protein